MHVWARQLMTMSLGDSVGIDDSTACSVAKHHVRSQVRSTTPKCGQETKGIDNNDFCHGVGDTPRTSTDPRSLPRTQQVCLEENAPVALRFGVYC